MLPSYWESILSRHSPLFKSLHGMWESLGQEAPRGRTTPPSSGPPPLVWMHIWCCVHLVEICWHTIIQAFFKENKTTKIENKTVALNGFFFFFSSRACFVNLAVRSPGVASDFSLSLSLGVSLSFRVLYYYCFFAVSHCVIWHYL